MESSYAKGIEPNSIAVKPHKRGLLSSSHTSVYMVILSTIALERFAVNKPRVEYERHL
jgi:hypothetical protein